VQVRVADGAAVDARGDLRGVDAAREPAQVDRRDPRALAGALDVNAAAFELDPQVADGVALASDDPQLGDAVRDTVGLARGEDGARAGELGRGVLVHDRGRARSAVLAGGTLCAVLAVTAGAHEDIPDRDRDGLTFVLLDVAFNGQVAEGHDLHA